MEVRILAQGLSEVIAGVEGKNAETSKAFERYLQSLFPFLAKSTNERDKKIAEVMKKESQRGPISFTPISTKTFRNSVRKIRKGDDFAETMRSKGRKLH